MDSKGWRFPTKEEIAESDSVGTPDHVNSYSRLSELYFSVEKDYPGRFTVPVLYDKQTKQIVNNESSEILRIFNSDFNSILPDSHAKIDLYPSKLKSEIDELNAWVYDNINNGVYKAGFAGTQEVYEKEAKNVFNYLDKVETILKKNHESNQDYLIGNDLTEADIRLFTTIVRFDPVYVQHFKVNQGTIRDNYPNINKWLKFLYWKIPAFKDTTDFDHIKFHYTKSHKAINPLGITPFGPVPNIQPLE